MSLSHFQKHIFKNLCLLNFTVVNCFVCITSCQYKATSGVVGLVTSSTATTSPSAYHSRLATLLENCCRKDRVTTSLSVTPTTTQTAVRCSSHHQEDDPTSCCWRQRRSAMPYAQNTFALFTSTAASASTLLQESGTTRRTSNRRPAVATKLK